MSKYTTQFELWSVEVDMVLETEDEVKEFAWGYGLVVESIEWDGPGGGNACVVLKGTKGHLEAMLDEQQYEREVHPLTLVGKITISIE